MKFVIYFVAVTVLLALNAGMFSYLKVYGVAPNLLLLLVTIFVLDKDNQDYFFVAMVSGIMLDVYAGVYMGSFTLAFLLLALFLHMAMDRVNVTDWGWKHTALAVAAALLFTDAVVWSFNYLAAYYELAPLSVEWQVMARRFVPELAYNVLLIYPVYAGVHFLKNMVRRLALKRRYEKIY